MDIQIKQKNQNKNFKSPDFVNRRGLKRLWIGRKPFLKITLSIIVLLVLSAATFFIYSRKDKPANSEVALASETSDLTEIIGKFMELPATEQPTLVTVTDKAKLKGQDFFERAQDGDKVLVYTQAKKVILFRPSTGKIIDVANLTSSNESSG